MLFIKLKKFPSIASLLRIFTRNVVELSQKLLLHQFVCLYDFSSLITMAGTSKTMLNNSGESGHPCLFPDLRGNAFRFSPLRMIFAVGLSYMAFIMLK